MSHFFEPFSKKCDIWGVKNVKIFKISNGLTFEDFPFFRGFRPLGKRKNLAPQDIKISDFQAYIKLHGKS